MYLFAIIIIGVTTLLRFVGLDASPPGFYIDEVMGAAQVLCLKEGGVDFYHHSLPFFSASIHGGYYTAPFLYGQILWTALFGDSIYAFRAFSAFVTSFTLFGVYFWVKEWTQNRNLALMASMVGSLMPWAYQFSRIAWDPPLGPLFLIWGLFLLSKSQKKAWWGGTLLLALGAYSYTPTRIQILCLLPFVPTLSKSKKVFVLSFLAVLCIPLLYYYFQVPEFMIRGKMLALSSDHPANPFRDFGKAEMISQAMRQMFMHLSPEFLFFRGDLNLRHSIQKYGELGWFAGLGIALLSFNLKTLWSSHRPRLLFLTFGVFAGLLPAALTWEGVPHALRAIGAWPFFSVISAYGLLSFYEKSSIWRKAIWGVGMSFCFLFHYSYFFEYPTYAKLSFESHLVENAKLASYPDAYPPLARAYFEMTVRGKTCENLRPR